MWPNKFRTRNIDLAVFLKYALPPEAHVATTRQENALAFIFSGLDECRELADLFFGSEPVAVGDVKAFNFASKALRQTMRDADANGGTWECEQ
jgi:hypothetical protein